MQRMLFNVNVIHPPDHVPMQLGNQLHKEDVENLLVLRH